MERDQLVAGLIAHDEDAWECFLRDYGGMIHAVASSFGLPQADRDDLFQNACLAIVRSIAGLRDPSRLASWVYAIAYRLGVDTTRRKREILLADLPEGTDPQADFITYDGTEETRQRLEEIALIQDALAAIDPRCRRLLIGLYLEEPRRTYAEIARTESIPIGSIGPTRARCLEKARILLRDLSRRPPRPSTNRGPEEPKGPGAARRREGP